MAKRVKLTAKQIDDRGVDTFARLMKLKLARKRAQGYSGWDTCEPAHLARLLVEHVVKGDPIDVANFAMMIHQRMARVGYHVSDPAIRSSVLRSAAQDDAESKRRACIAEFLSKLNTLVEREP